MKNKKIIAALLVIMLGAMYSANAQSAVEKKIKEDLQRSKNHREAMLLKAREQQQQRQDERKEPNANAAQQQINNAPASGQRTTQPKQQPKEAIPILPAKKEDIKQ